jgi:hypothetical protein
MTVLEALAILEAAALESKKRASTPPKSSVGELAAAWYTRVHNYEKNVNGLLDFGACADEPLLVPVCVP